MWSDERLHLASQTACCMENFKTMKHEQLETKD